ncbi:MAG: DUF4278 domain-containing protein, partial [Leptolyngbyaceae cyanobacterium SL_1_1]|nr:DUF4278 domain-containing protein [Leptolyngbyaceae cyanobacterium SL_1_1]
MELLILLAIALVVFTASSVLLAGILAAPWIVVVGVLLLMLFIIQWLSLQSKPQSLGLQDSSPSANALVSRPAATEETKNSAVDSGLIYRGVRYKAQPQTQQPSEQPEISGIYRGHPWHKEPVDSTDQTSSGKSTP